MSRLVLFILCVLITACTFGPRTPTPQPAVESAFSPFTMVDPVVAEGKTHYDKWCGHCHGYQGEGQLEATIQNTLSLGMFTVPSHDSTGHTWQHPDFLLMQVIKKGVQNPLNHYQMPAFETTLTDAQIMTVIAYMRQWWTPEQRQHQAEVTRRWNQANP